MGEAVPEGEGKEELDERDDHAPLPESLAQSFAAEFDPREHDEDEDAEVRDDSEGRAEFRGRVRIDPAEDQRAEEDAGEDLPDHRRLMDLLHRLAGGARCDEDQQEGKEEVHGRTAWTRSTRPRLIYALAVGYLTASFEMPLKD